MVRNIPLPSRIIMKFMNVIYATSYLILKPTGLAPCIMAFLSGGLFGLLLLPVVALHSMLSMLRSWILPEDGMYHDIIVYSLWAFVGWYLVTILIDDTHCCVEDACFHEPQDEIDRLSYEFFKEIFTYFPMECIPVSSKVKQQLTVANNNNNNNSSSKNSTSFVFGVHPHGIHCFPLALLASPDTPFDTQFPGLVSGSKATAASPHPLTGLAASIMFKIPVVREFFLAFGYIDASRKVADSALASGRSIFVVTGGEEESMYSNKTASGGKEDILVLKNRKGFVRLALRHGAALVPIYGINNNDTFKTYTFAMGLRQWIQKTFKIALPIFHGRYLTPLPYQVPIKTIVGEPIPTPKPRVEGEKPDEKLVDEYHQKYIAAIKDMHSKFADCPLRIV